MNDQTYHGMSFISEGDYYPSIVTYCEIEEKINDSNTGTKDFKKDFVTFDDKLINCNDCKETEDYKETKKNAKIKNKMDR